MTHEERLCKLIEALGSEADMFSADFGLTSVESMVLSYINHETLPKELDNTVILMATAYCKSAALGSMDTSEGAVTKIKRGDTEVSYNAGASPSANTFDLVNGEGLAGWRTILNEYRRLRW